MMIESINYFLLLTLVKNVMSLTPLWGQCGGEGFTGFGYFLYFDFKSVLSSNFRNFNRDKYCNAGLACVFVNQWYSQCQPSALGTTVGPIATTIATISCKKGK